MIEAERNLPIDKSNGVIDELTAINKIVIFEMTIYFKMETGRGLYGSVQWSM